MKAKCWSKAQRLSLDRVSTLPQTIIESILRLLPIEEAARTSILSREWRYKWTKIPQLVFLHSTLRERTNKEVQLPERRRKLLCATIHQILLLHQGPIREFSLSMCTERSCFELDQIILHLSRNHRVKKLSLEVLGSTNRYKMPFSVFSFQHLTDLYLCWVDLDHHAIFSGFGNLRSLYLKYVRISKKALLHFLSNCPSLNRLSLFTGQRDIHIIELLKCLPAIEHLNTWTLLCPPLQRGLVLKSVPDEQPTLLIHLKCFSFEESYVRANESTFLNVLIMIKCSPNLEKIKIDCRFYDRTTTCSYDLGEYSDVWLEHLNELEINYFKNLKCQMDFVKFILARSPKLRKVKLTTDVDKDEEFGMLTNLLRAPRVSPVQIVVDSC